MHGRVPTSLIAESAAVTIEELVAFTNVGTFTYLPAGPACQYYGLSAWFGAECTFDSPPGRR